MAMLLRGASADGSRPNHAMELLDLSAPTTCATHGSLGSDDKSGPVRAP
jgi:hypothetical protein